LRGRRKRGAERNALGRSRGGFSTKINARTNAEGLPIGVVMTPGQAHDVTAFPALMHEIDCDPKQTLDAIAKGIKSFVDGMLYFSDRGAGNCGFTTALLNVAADGLAIVALVTKQC
jgi:hypothetical protein